MKPKILDGQTTAQIVEEIKNKIINDSAINEELTELVSLTQGKAEFDLIDIEVGCLNIRDRFSEILVNNVINKIKDEGKKSSIPCSCGSKKYFKEVKKKILKHF